VAELGPGASFTTMQARKREETRGKREIKRE